MSGIEITVITDIKAEKQAEEKDERASMSRYGL